MSINAIIDEAFAPAEAQPKVDAPKEVETVDAQTETPEPESPETPEPEEKEEVVFPKKAVNLLNKKSGQIGKLKAQLTQQRAETEKALQEVERYKTVPKNSTDGRPKEEDFEGKPYGDYLDALTDWKVNQKLSERDAKSSEEKSKSTAENLDRELSKNFDKKGTEVREKIKDFDQVLEDNEDDLKGMAPHVKQAFLEADNGPLAMYALAKEGMIDDLNEMSPLKVAMLIGKMEDYSLPKQTSNAPKPMTPAKGTSTGGKKLEDLSGDDIRKWLRDKT